MSRRKNGGDLTPVPVLFGLLLVVMAIGVITLACGAWQKHTETNAQPATATPTPAVTTPAPTQPDTQPSTPEHKEEQATPPENPCGIVFGVMKERVAANGNLSAADLDAIFAKYGGQYANVQVQKEKVPSSDGHEHETWSMRWTDTPGFPYDDSPPAWGMLLAVDVFDGKVQFATYSRARWMNMHIEALSGTK